MRSWPFSLPLRQRFFVAPWVAAIVFAVLTLSIAVNLLITQNAWNEALERQEDLSHRIDAFLAKHAEAQAAVVDVLRHGKEGSDEGAIYSLGIAQLDRVRQLSAELILWRKAFLWRYPNSRGIQ